MIEFKIVSCPDKSQQASYLHLGLELTIGKTDGDMLVDDPGFGPAQLKIKIESGQTASLENLNKAVEMRLNGKPISGTVPLKEKDNLTVSRTTFTFTRLDNGAQLAPEPYVNPLCKDRFSEGSKEKALMDVLAFLEKQASGATAGAPAPEAGSPKPPPLPGTAPAKPPLPPLPPKRS